LRRRQSSRHLPLPSLSYQARLGEPPIRAAFS
jgi:hypothetical protein